MNLNLGEFEVAGFVQVLLDAQFTATFLTFIIFCTLASFTNRLDVSPQTSSKKLHHFFKDMATLHEQDIATKTNCYVGLPKFGKRTT